MEEGTTNVRCLRAPFIKVIETFAQASNRQEGRSDVLNIYDIKSKLFGQINIEIDIIALVEVYNDMRNYHYHDEKKFGKHQKHQQS